jgi:hypothetical protein
MTVSSDDRERDKEIIIQNFMEELCRRDDEDNRNYNINSDRVLNIFPIEQIRQKHLSTYEIEYVKDVLREYIQENREKEPLDLLDNEENVRLTNIGRSLCEEYGI